MGLEPEVRIIKDGLTHQEAYIIEMQTIASFVALGHKLVNLNGGGTGILAPSAKFRAEAAAGRAGKKHTPETIAKMCVAQKGRKVSQKTRAILAEIARNMPQEQRDKISKSLTGRKLSPERAQQARTANLGRKHTPEAIENMSKAARKSAVYCVTNGITYPSMRAAASELGIHETAVSMACRGVRKSAGAYIFKYADV
jgi:tyrosyl-tRNA synthetase